MEYPSGTALVVDDPNPLARVRMPYQSRAFVQCEADVEVEGRTLADVASLDGLHRDGYREPGLPRSERFGPSAPKSRLAATGEGACLRSQVKGTGVVLIAEFERTFGDPGARLGEFREILAPHGTLESRERDLRFGHAGGGFGSAGLALKLREIANDFLSGGVELFLHSLELHVPLEELELQSCDVCLELGVRGRFGLDAHCIDDEYSVDRG